MSFSPCRRPWLVAIPWLLAAAALLPLSTQVEHRLEVQARILGSESAEVEEALRVRFASPFAVSALCVLAGAPSPETAEGRRLLEQAVAELQKAPGVTRAFSFLDRPDPLLVGAGGQGGIVVLGLDPGGGRVDRLVPELRRVAHALEERFRPVAPGLSVRFTGEGPINYDLWRSSADDARLAERRTLPLTLALLLLAFGAAAAAFVPVATGALAVGLSLGLVALVAEHTPISILAVNVTSMLGLALGIDYALLTVSRFREARAEGLGSLDAAEAAGRHAGATVALSGVPVAIGFMALFNVPLNEMRSAALAGLVVTLVSVLLSLTLLPLLLGWLGPRVEAGRIFAPGARQGFYRRLAAAVVKRPALVLALTVPPLLLLAAEARRLSPTIPRGRWLPAATESARAERDLELMGRSGLLYSARVLV
ncbi:MAG TPA: MMPL family transporter, partial [Vicinamibacteria bacterium]